MINHEAYNMSSLRCNVKPYCRQEHDETMREESFKDVVCIINTSTFSTRMVGAHIIQSSPSSSGPSVDGSDLAINLLKGHFLRSSSTHIRSCHFPEELA